MFTIFIFIHIYFLFVASFDVNLKQCKPYVGINDSISQIVKVPKRKVTSNSRIRYFEQKSYARFVMGHAVFVDNIDAIQVLQPENKDDGCELNRKSLVRQTSILAGNCEVAINAGFFEVKSGKCFGSIVNEGKIYQNFHGFRNAHFGITNDGSLYFGYPTIDEINSKKFRMLVGGAIWLIRNGKSFIDESIKQECSSVQDTGAMEYFSKVISARTAIGALSNGTVIMITVGGRTSQFGVSLYDLVQVLLDSNLNIVSAINLDGGGSTSLVINDTLVTLPSDKCDGDTLFTCERPVSTVLCVKKRKETSNFISKHYYVVTFVILGFLFLFVFGILVLALIMKIRANKKLLNYDVHFDRQILLNMSSDDHDDDRDGNGDINA